MQNAMRLCRANQTYFYRPVLSRNR